MAEKARGKDSKRKRKGNGIGHNSGQVPDEVYERWLPKIETAAKAMDRAKEAYDSARGRYQNVIKAMEDDGGHRKGMLSARKLAKRDPAEVALEHEATGQILRVMQHQLVVQLDLFPLPKRAPTASAWLAGTQAGKSGAPVDDNPHTPGSEVFEEWLSGHKHGAAAAVKSFGGDDARA
jgi:hypothetical protein